MAKEPRPKGYPKLKNYKPSQFMLPTSHYDKKKADRAVTFIENLCHTKGKWAGTPFWLLPWQEQLIRDIFGIVKPDGNRQFRTAFVEICKKVGKSELAAAIALYLLYADNEPSAEVYGAAADRQQASIVFDVAKQMVEMSPALMKRSKLMAATKRIVNYGKLFADELYAGSGPVTIWLNSPGGDCIAASQIYAMLMDYKGDVTIKIDGIAASAASVIAMAGTTVLMAPTSLMMIHNPMTMAFGDHEDMKKAMEMLGEVKESIINAYEIRTGLSRAKLSHYMDSETWMNANKAIELGFADDVLRDEKRTVSDEAFAFSGKAAQTSLMNKLCRPVKNAAIKTDTMAQMAAIPAKDRLFVIGLCSMYV